MRIPVRDLFAAWVVATLFSGAPSTLWALATGGDPFEATRAAAAMLAPRATSPLAVLGAAAIVHSTVSAFWIVVFGAMLPRRRIALFAMCGAAAVAVLDLKLVAPLFFPAVAQLSFWPQFADHVMWGVCVGVTLQLRERGHSGAARPSNS